VELLLNKSADINAQGCLMMKMVSLMWMERKEEGWCMVTSMFWSLVNQLLTRCWEEAFFTQALCSRDALA